MISVEELLRKCLIEIASRAPNDDRSRKVSGNLHLGATGLRVITFEARQIQAAGMASSQTSGCPHLSPLMVDEDVRIASIYDDLGR